MDSNLTEQARAAVEPSPENARAQESAGTPGRAEAQEGARASQPKKILLDARWLNWSAIVFAILQSACTAVIAISGVRVAIGLGALAAAAGIHAPAHGFHQDAIRIPMMALALLGSVINLYVVWKVRHLRNKPAAQWRQQPLTKRKLNSERFQIALSILTLLLLAVEWITHPMIHRVP
ncbi:MAG TPA: hypothetical protein VH114_00070 [Candidatus Acidoferrum sp.]|nr:hypothetical protein [Candidatus Acidoferrum sp.]